MKKRIVGHLGVVALALTLVSMTLMGGTVAKYTTTVSGSAEATVAKFAFDLNGATQASDSAAINLKDLFKSTYGNGKEVKSKADSAPVVAPGTSGYVKLEVKNNGEVAITPQFVITETNTAGIPLEYAITKTSDSPADWETATAIRNQDLGNIAVGTTGNTGSFYLHWKWSTAESDGDKTDTAFGIKESLDKITLEIECTVSQALPTAPPEP